MADSKDDSNLKSNYGKIALVTALPLVIAGGVYIAWNYMSGWFWKKQPKPKDGGAGSGAGSGAGGAHLARCVSFATLHGGKLALERLLDYHHYRANVPELKAALSDLKNLIEQERPNFKDIHRLLMKLEMTRKEDEAVEVLEKALEKAKKNSHLHEAYEIEMLLVEMFIYKGDLEKALNCKCLNEEDISDARRPLYKAIIHFLLKHSRDVIMPYWDEFREARTDLLSPPITEEQDQFYKLITHFDEFTKVVSVLEKDIEEAKRLKKVLNK